MSSMIKTFYNQKILHSNFKNLELNNDIRFTKVLTKYSTEYNNMLFIQNLCQQLGLDKKDTFSFFLELRNNKTVPKGKIMVETSKRLGSMWQNLDEEAKSIVEIKEIIDFIKIHIERGICNI